MGAGHFERSRAICDSLLAPARLTVFCHSSAVAYYWKISRPGSASL